MPTIRSLTVCRASAGSGKTYTLAAHYVALLMRGMPFRNILAVTFTNKATEEMKQRILTYLYAIAQGKGGSFVEKVCELMQPFGEVPSDEELRLRADKIFHAILAEYDDMRITTIDSFLQQLLSGLARMLGCAAGYTVDLDSDHAITEAVDQIMSTHIDEQSGLLEDISGYLNQQMDDERSWDIRQRLIAAAKELYHESVQKLSDQIVLDPHIIQAFRTELLNSSDPSKEATMEYLNDLKLLSYIFYRIQANQTENNTILLACTAHILRQALRPGDADFILEKAGIRYHHIMLDEFQDTSTLQWENFLPLIREILAGGGTTLIVGDVKQSIYRWRNGDWHIMASLGEDTPYLGAYFAEQPLSRNYRSCREIVRFNMNLFAPLYAELYDADRLQDYYVAGVHEGGAVQVSFYPYSRTSTKPTKSGKMPSDAVLYLRSDVQRKAILKDMFTTIEELLSAGCPPEDILILIRVKSEVRDILEVYNELIADTSRYPHLAQHRPVSPDSYALSASPAVRLVIAALKSRILEDKTAAHYISLVCQPQVSEALEHLSAEMPLTFLIEDIIRLCLCPSGEYKGEDIAYLNCFKDKVRDYVGRFGSNAKAFLQYWEDKMRSEAIPADEAGNIRIMTIHSAKGLEAANVFIPGCKWDMEENNNSNTKLWCQVPDSLQPADPSMRMGYIPVSNNNSLLKTAYKDAFIAEHADERQDNLNLLYVALTRAAERLYVYCPITWSTTATKTTYTVANCSSVAHLLLAHLGTQKAINDLWENYHPGANQVVSYRVGQIEAKPTAKAASASDEIKPFAFDKAEVLPAHYYSDNTHIRFRQSQQAQRYWAGDEPIGSRDFGNLCHDILSQMTTLDDASRVIDDFWARGLIDSNATLRRIKEAIADIAADTQMADFFSPRWQLLNESTILCPTPPYQLRPDRVMINGNTAIVLDYKFGDMKAHYTQQVRQYMQLFRQLGYQEVKGCIWLAQTRTLQWIS